MSTTLQSLHNRSFRARSSCRVRISFRIVDVFDAILADGQGERKRRQAPKHEFFREEIILLERELLEVNWQKSKVQFTAERIVVKHELFESSGKLSEETDPAEEFP